MKKELPQSQKYNWVIHAHNVLKVASEVILPYLLIGDALNSLNSVSLTIAEVRAVSLLLCCSELPQVCPEPWNLTRPKGTASIFISKYWLKETMAKLPTVLLFFYFKLTCLKNDFKQFIQHSNKWTKVAGLSLLKSLLTESVLFLNYNKNWSDLIFSLLSKLFNLDYSEVSSNTYTWMSSTNTLKTHHFPFLINSAEIHLIG